MVKDQLHVDEFRSFSGWSKRVKVRFVDESQKYDRSVQIKWVNFDGDEQLEGTLPHNSSTGQRIETGIGHLFVMRHAISDELLYTYRANGLREDVTVRLSPYGLCIRVCSFLSCLVLCWGVCV